MTEAFGGVEPLSKNKARACTIGRSVPSFFGLGNTCLSANIVNSHSRHLCPRRLCMGRLPCLSPISYRQGDWTSAMTRFSLRLGSDRISALIR